MSDDQDQHDEDRKVTPIDRPARPGDDPRRRRSRAHDVPRLAEAADELASLYDLLEREPDAEVGALVARSQRKRDDPALFEDIAKILVAMRRERTGNRQRERDMEVVLREPHAAAKSSRRYLIATVVAAATSIGGAVGQHTGASSPPSTSVGDTVQIRELQRQSDQLQHQIDRVDAELRDVRQQLAQLLGRRSELLPHHPAGDLPALTFSLPSLSSKGLLP